MSLSRREIIGAGAAAASGLLAGAAALAEQAGAQEEIPTFRYPLEEQKGRVMAGGSAKEQSVRQLPIATGLAGVSMRLKPGALRELHWHTNAAEWGYVIKGRCRTTILGPESATETNDFGAGDVWYFPRGHGHSIQGLGTEECHFILVFDSGGFSEFGTFSSTDWVAHTPAEVLAKDLGIPKADVGRFPKKELYIVQGPVPPDQPEPNRGTWLRPWPSTHRYPLRAQKPTTRLAGGREWRVTVKEFPISTTIAGVLLNLYAGGLREPHWHPNANEWQYYISGKARMTLFGSRGRARTEEFGPGDVGYVPQGFGHYIENIGDTACVVLLALDNGVYEEISLSTWLAANPTQLIADNFQIPEKLVNQLPRHRVYLPGKDGPGE
jgi:oxalate decarboxylase